VYKTKSANRSRQTHPDPYSPVRRGFLDRRFAHLAPRRPERSQPEPGRRRNQAKPRRAHSPARLHSRNRSAQPGQAGEAARPASQPYLLTATVRELMDGIIDPSADVLWDSVAYIATTKGIEDRQPRTPEEWKAVRTSAITLIEAANLLSMPGRHVAAAQLPGDAPVAPAPGELTHDEIQQRINSTHETFVGFAKNLQNAD